MSILVRRSNLIMPATQLRMIRWAWNLSADAVSLDLQDGIPPGELETARDTLRPAVSQVAKGGAEAFVRVNSQSDLRGCRRRHVHRPDRHRRART